MLGVIYRTFKYHESTIMRLLYTSLVRPHLDYASNIWNLYIWNYFFPSASNIIMEYGTILYSKTILIMKDYISALNLPSHQYHRRRMDLIKKFT